MVREAATPPSYLQNWFFFDIHFLSIAPKAKAITSLCLAEMLSGRSSAGCPSHVRSVPPYYRSFPASPQVTNSRLKYRKACAIVSPISNHISRIQISQLEAIATGPPNSPNYHAVRATSARHRRHLNSFDTNSPCLLKVQNARAYDY